MPFDLSTAKPVTDEAPVKKFDLASSKPVEETEPKPAPSYGSQAYEFAKAAGKTLAERTEPFAITLAKEAPKTVMGLPRAFEKAAEFVKDPITIARRNLEAINKRNFVKEAAEAVKSRWQDPTGKGQGEIAGEILSLAAPGMGGGVTKAGRSLASKMVSPSSLARETSARFWEREGATI